VALIKLRLENISKSFGENTVLQGVSMDVAEGDFISILGPSGCGKTTLLRLIAGLEVPCGGNIFIDGKCCANVPARKRGAVIVFQDYGLFPHMTVAANIEFGLAARKENKASRTQKVNHMLDVMQISDKAGSMPHQLSGGQKQRVALARACVLEPQILLLDEPFSNLDPGLKDHMREFVQKLQIKLGITTILVTHDKEEAFMLSQRVAIMLDGKFEQFDTPRQIYAHPQTLQVADFIGEANYINGAITDGIFSCAFGDFAINHEGGTHLMLRYDQLLIEHDAVGGGLPCTILEIIFKGRTTTYRVAFNESEIKINSPYAVFEVGDKAFIRVRDDAGCII